MSGHSHAKTVMATKMANDAKKGKVYSKYGRLITIAVKEGGGSGDPEKNSKLKAVIEQAKAMNMPKENIERAIKKGTGELAGESLEEVSYEGFGPGGIALIIEGISDNTNRTLGEIKSILNQNNGKMAGEGAVRWMFERKGVIIINSKLQIPNYKNEELEMLAIECGADDVRWDGDKFDIYTKPEDLEKIKKTVEQKGIKTDSASLDFVAKEEVAISEKEKAQAQTLFEALDENDAVNEIYSNLKN
ncbi:MAG: YebC/PmpR family DNA-binding transcriptional regulator [Candidatus Staskawiczbacteria bacterium]|nr:YebC/PmpR family DNA-binding transcriptional regulator [Candidatus Staskawiczbacteria bacterium]